MSKWNWRTFRFEDEPENKFSSAPVLIPDEGPFYTTDPRLGLLLNFNGFSRNNAMQVPAVARGMHSITALANLPMQTFDRNNKVRANRLIDQVDPDMPNVILMSRTIEDLTFDGVAVWEVTERASNGYPISARHVPRHRWSLQERELDNGDIEYTYWLYGKQVEDNSRVIRFDSPRAGLLGVMAQAVRQAIALQVTMEGFAKNPMPKMVVTSTGDVAPERDEIVSNLQAFKSERADNPIAYLGPNLEIKEINLLSPQELQLIESSENVTKAIANFFDMDPEEVGISTTSRTYNNAVDRRIDRRNNQLQWIAQAIEQRLSMPDITPRGYTVRFNFDEFLRVDPKTKAEIAQIEMSMGALTVNEYRLDTGRAPLTPEQQQEMKPMNTNQIQANRPPGHTFDADVEVNLDFEGAKFARESVNTTSRTVVGLVVPYGQYARSQGRKWEFEKGSIGWSDLSRVKLLRDHDMTQSVGHAIFAQDTDQGLEMTFKVAPGPAGDKSLADFASGSNDGLSAGADWEIGDFVPHPTKPGVNLVKRAQLREVSQVAIPAFDDSRSVAVHMSRETAEVDGENNMSEENTEAQTSPDVAKLIADAVSAAFAAQNTNVIDEAPIQDTAPALESKPKEKENTVTATFVNEEPAYRFDGIKGQHSFSADLYAMNMNGDHEATKRIEEYMRKEFAVTVSNTSALNPTIQTGQYVDLKDYPYPIWNAIKKGNVPNGVQPFGWVKYNSSGTLVSDHTEGTEPSLGTASFASQTVTPSMVSGKIEVNREAWEMRGDPAVDQLIRGLMVKAYNEALETAAAAFLDAATLTDITLTTAAADDVLVDNLVSELINLLVTRGGFTMNDLFLQADLYKALAMAKDADNRYLLPALGATNAVGTTQNRFKGLDINGLVGVPAWALAAPGQTASANSYLLDRNDVAGWASAPHIQNFDIQVKSVYIGLWGYKAFAVQNATGVRRIKWDPAA